VLQTDRGELEDHGEETGQQLGCLTDGHEFLTLLGWVGGEVWGEVFIGGRFYLYLIHFVMGFSVLYCNSLYGSIVISMYLGAV
jgi:hypothetical protein